MPANRSKTDKILLLLASGIYNVNHSVFFYRLPHYLYYQNQIRKINSIVLCDGNNKVKLKLAGSGVPFGASSEYPPWLLTFCGGWFIQQKSIHVQLGSLIIIQGLLHWEKAFLNVPAKDVSFRLALKSEVINMPWYAGAGLKSRPVWVSLGKSLTSFFTFSNSSEKRPETLVQNIRQYSENIRNPRKKKGKENA